MIIEFKNKVQLVLLKLVKSSNYLFTSLIISIYLPWKMIILVISSSRRNLIKKNWSMISFLFVSYLEMILSLDYLLLQSKK